MDKYFIYTLNNLGLGVGMAFFVLPTVATNFQRVFKEDITVVDVEDLIESESAIKVTLLAKDAEPLTLKYYLTTTSYYSYTRLVVNKVEIV